MSHPAAQFELPWPLEINDRNPGGLNCYINLPAEWQTKPGSGLDSFMIEGSSRSTVNERRGAPSARHQQNGESSAFVQKNACTPA